MKINTDFVTNSSSDSMAEVVIDNLVLLEILQRYKDMGVFGDAEIPFEIGFYRSDDENFGTPDLASEISTPAFYIFEDVCQGTPMVWGIPKSLNKVLTDIISIMDNGDYFGMYDEDLYDQLRGELHEREAEIKDGYMKVWWRYKYTGSEFLDEGPNENEWVFSYDPENGEKNTVGYYEAESDEEIDEG